MCVYLCVRACRCQLDNLEYVTTKYTNGFDGTAEMSHSTRTCIDEQVTLMALLKVYFWK